MTLSEIMLNTKDVSMERLVFQSDIKTDEDIAYYHNDNVGYVHLNSVYKTLTNIIEDTLVNAKVFSYIDGVRECSFEIRL